MGICRETPGDERSASWFCETGSENDLGRLGGMYPAVVWLSRDGKTLASGGWRTTLWDASGRGRKRDHSTATAAPSKHCYFGAGRQNMLVSGGSDCLRRDLGLPKIKRKHEIPRKKTEEIHCILSIFYPVFRVSLLDIRLGGVGVDLLQCAFPHHGDHAGLSFQRAKQVGHGGLGAGADLAQHADG